MGMYINPGSEGFAKAIRSKIYVDKTGLIEYTNSVIGTEQGYICVSRPRRFGKTMALNMLSAYYDCSIDSKAMFADFKIGASKSFTEYINSCHVLFINMVEFATMKRNAEEMIADLQNSVIRDIRAAYADINYSDTTKLYKVLQDVYIFTRKKFVILIDEWDCVLREHKDDEKWQKEYLDFLRLFLKDKLFINLVYMTGILPIKKYGNHSALNMFDEFSMLEAFDLAEFTGITETEVKQLCDKYCMSFGETKAWYDGYYLQGIGSVYNPKSLVTAMIKKKFYDYWNQTEAYEALKVYIDLNYDGLRDIILSLMSGEKRKIDSASFSNDMVTFQDADDILTLLVHLGYLGYMSDTKEVFIPNNEVREEFANAVKHSEVYTEVAKAVKVSDELLEATINGEADKVAKIIESVHLENSHLQYNDENALAYTVALAYYTARRKYNIVREMPTGKGFADMVFLPKPYMKNTNPMIIELKWNHSVKTAIKQIKEKNYLESLKDYQGEIILAGINYSKKTRKHTCKIEKFELS